MVTPVLIQKGKEDISTFLQNKLASFDTTQTIIYRE